ncbi:hypothetical protein Lal_00028402 [Lupinus albus]|nr:hypothetical protein Lal_00028402 [Lupinus albus]
MTYSFVLFVHDASPITEEYEVLLDIHVLVRENVYLFIGIQNVTKDIIERLIGVRPCPSSIVKQGLAYGFRWKFFKTSFRWLSKESGICSNQLSHPDFRPHDFVRVATTFYSKNVEKSVGPITLGLGF